MVASNAKAQTNSNLVFLEINKQRTGGAISPGFGFVMIIFLFAGTFVLAGLKEEATLQDKLTFALIPSVMTYFIGILLFQSFSLIVDNKQIRWRSSIIPGLWQQKWVEPASNYRGLLLKRTKPVNGVFYPRYCPDSAVLPRKITGENTSQRDKEYNKKNFVVILLKHKYDLKKDVALKAYPATSRGDIKFFCNSAQEKLGLELLN